MIQNSNINDFKNLAPIVLFVYNRPDHTRRTVESLQKNILSSKSVLYIFSDGAKDNANVEQIENIRMVRDYIHTINGFKDIYIEESNTNKGLATSIVTGVKKVINQFGKVIVLEDDLITHPYFLTFMNICLDFYENRNDIFMVSGFSNNISFPFWYQKDVYLLPRSCSWGWGTWIDRWNKADWDVSNFSKMKSDPKMIEKFNQGGFDMFPMLMAQMNGQIDSWAIRWDYSMFLQQGLTLHPTKTFLKNIGADGSGTHGGLQDQDLFIAPFYDKSIFNICLPQNLKRCIIIEDNYRNFVRSLYGSRNFSFKRIWQRMSCYLRFYK